jgi:CHAD domain-containing protein
MEERELKFTPSPSFRLPRFDGAMAGIEASAPETVRLQAAYFDTPDLRLARAGASLRYRNDGGWTVKLPVARTSVLTRLELPVPGEIGDPPEQAVDLVRALVRAAPFALAARLNSVRTRVVLQQHGVRVAEIVDDEVSVLDGARLAARFREIEAEFTDDASDDLVHAVTRRLRGAGAGDPDPVPKIVRALGPRALDPPDLVPPPSLDFASTPIEVLRAAITWSTIRLVEHDPIVRIGVDPEGVHQARVATRRMRSDLRTFRNFVDPDWDAALRDELKWLGQLLGAVRDDDVLLARLDERVQTLPSGDADAGKELLDGLREHRDRARAELLGAMRSDRYTSLLDQLVSASRHIPVSADAVDDDVDLGDLARKPWRKLRKAAEALDEHSSGEALHAARIRAKRCRYAAEAVAPALGKGARRFAKAVARLQDVLGEHQDAVVAERWLRAHASTTDPARASERAFVAGELTAFERVAAEQARADWPSAWKKARRKRLRDWM